MILKGQILTGFPLIENKDLTLGEASMKDQFVPLDAVLEMIADFCPDCQEKMRRHLNTPNVRPNPARMELRALIETVCQENNFPIATILGRCNEARFVNVRREISIRARREGYSYPRIGAALGRHHTTIIHLVSTQNLESRHKGR
jgi:Bacterial dnaA protein helix-turn-helix